MPSTPTARASRASPSACSTPLARTRASERRSSSRAVGRGVSRDRPRHRRCRASGGQPLALPCPDAAAHRRRARRGHHRGRAGHRATRRRRSTAVVPLPVRRRRATTRESCAAIETAGYRHVGWHVATDDWDPDRDGPSIERDVLAGRRCPRRWDRRAASRLAARDARAMPASIARLRDRGATFVTRRRARRGAGAPSWT